jgi:hypothetical protein
VATAPTALAMSARDWIERIEYPDPADHRTADSWIDAVLLGESARGPQRQAAPASTYALLWAIWLSAVPYGIWSERIRQPSMDERGQRVDRLEAVLDGALDQFDLAVRDGSVRDLAEAFATLIEGVWLNQCLTDRHPSDPGEPVSTLLLRSGRFLWRGATAPRGRAAAGSGRRRVGPPPPLMPPGASILHDGRPLPRS